MSRPRRSAAATTLSSRSDANGNANEQDPNVDPEFLALSAKQKRNIDKAFNRGVQILEAGSRKKRKVEKKSDQDQSEGVKGGFMEEDEDQDQGGFMHADEVGAGGFMDDGDDEAGAGGFMLNDEGGGGGFLPDDQDEGGFMTSDQPKSKSRSASIPPTENKRIPLHLLPPLLTSLGLPSDEDVLSVFKASASGWEEEESTSYRKRGPRGDEESDNLGVELKDFRAVCAALMEPDNGEDDGEDNGDDSQEDTFELPSNDEDSELSSLSGSEYGNDSPRPPKNKNKSKISSRVKSTDFAETESSTPASRRKLVTRGNKKNLMVDSNGKVRLNTRQKELAKDIWEMLKPPRSSSNVNQHQSKRGDSISSILGRDEVKKWVRELGEMWNDEEITEMVTLFSSQHEGRGLTFDDFSAVMLRAGLV